MKTCKNCGAVLDDNAAFCGTCGAKQDIVNDPNNTADPNQNPNPNQGFNNYDPNQNPNYNYQQPKYDIYDHTFEYDPKEISDNKVIAMIIYLVPAVGLIIALLADHNQDKDKPSYIGFHIRQGLKIEVLAVLVMIIIVIIAMIASLFSLGSASTYYYGSSLALLGGSVFSVLLMMVFLIADLVVRIICFVSVCKSLVKEAPIVRSIGFMK